LLRPHPCLDTPSTPGLALTCPGMPRQAFPPNLAASGALRTVQRSPRKPLPLRTAFQPRPAEPSPAGHVLPSRALPCQPCPALMVLYAPLWRRLPIAMPLRTASLPCHAVQTSPPKPSRAMPASPRPATPTAPALPDPTHPAALVLFAPHSGLIAETAAAANSVSAPPGHASLDVPGRASPRHPGQPRPDWCSSHRTAASCEAAGRYE
jgi:hypothetical protein